MDIQTVRNVLMTVQDGCRASPYNVYTIICCLARLEEAVVGRGTGVERWLPSQTGDRYPGVAPTRDIKCDVRLECVKKSRRNGSVAHNLHGIHIERLSVIHLSSRELWKHRDPVAVHGKKIRMPNT